MPPLSIDEAILGRIRSRGSWSPSDGLGELPPGELEAALGRLVAAHEVEHRGTEHHEELVLTELGRRVAADPATLEHLRAVLVPGAVLTVPDLRHVAERTQLPWSPALFVSAGLVVAHPPGFVPTPQARTVLDLVERVVHRVGSAGRLSQSALTHDEWRAVRRLVSVRGTGDSLIRCTRRRSRRYVLPAGRPRGRPVSSSGLHLYREQLREQREHLNRLGFRRFHEPAVTDRWHNATALGLGEGHRVHDASRTLDVVPREPGGRHARAPRHWVLQGQASAATARFLRSSRPHDGYGRSPNAGAGRFGMPHDFKPRTL